MCAVEEKKKKLEVCNVVQREKGETEMEGGRKWRWMEGHWITGEGQAGFTTGCHGSSIILGSLPWEKLLDEGQRLKRVEWVCVTKHCSNISTLTTSYHYISIYAPLGRKSRVTLTWGVCVQYVCVCTHSVSTKQHSDVNTPLPSTPDHKRNKQVGKSNGVCGTMCETWIIA